MTTTDESSMALLSMLNEKGLVPQILKAIPAEQHHVFNAWMNRTESLLKATEKVHEVVMVKRGTTRKNTPMWLCTTTNGTEFYVFHPFTLTGWELYKPEFMAMKEDEILYWDDCPIRVKLEPDGKFLKPIWIEQRPEGSAPNERQRAFNVSFVRWIYARQFAVIDFETTGLDDSEIVEIGVVFYDGRPSIHRLIKPQKPIPAEATAIHCVGNDDVVDCPSFAEVWAEIAPMLEGIQLVAWNAEFELARLRYEFSRIADCTFKLPDIVCAMKGYTAGGYKKMSVALKESGIATKERLHSGVNDAQACLEIIKVLRERVHELDAKRQLASGEARSQADVVALRGASDGGSNITTLDHDTETDGGDN